jgi:hypothetical protein
MARVHQLTVYHRPDSVSVTFDGIPAMEVRLKDGHAWVEVREADARSGWAPAALFFDPKRLDTMIEAVAAFNAVVAAETKELA